jgi:hypothetical protein
MQHPEHAHHDHLSDKVKVGRECEGPCDFSAGPPSPYWSTSAQDVEHGQSNELDDPSTNGQKLEPRNDDPIHDGIPANTCCQQDSTDQYR